MLIGGNKFSASAIFIQLFAIRILFGGMSVTRFISYVNGKETHVAYLNFGRLVAELGLYLILVYAMTVKTDHIIHVNIIAAGLYNSALMIVTSQHLDKSTGYPTIIKKLPIIICGSTLWTTGTSHMKPTCVKQVRRLARLTRRAGCCQGLAPLLANTTPLPPP